MSPTRKASAAKRFLAKALRFTGAVAHPKTINTDKNPSYAKALSQLKQEGKCATDLAHSQVKYLNNIVESDHAKLKRLIKPTTGFKSMKSAYATIKGFEIMRMFKKGQFKPYQYEPDHLGEISLITRNLLAA